MITDKETLLC